MKQIDKKIYDYKEYISKNFFFLKMVNIFVIDPYVHFYTYELMLLAHLLQSAVLQLTAQENYHYFLQPVIFFPPFRTCGSFNTNKSTTH